MTKKCDTSNDRNKHLNKYVYATKAWTKGHYQSNYFMNNRCYAELEAPNPRNDAILGGCLK